MGSVLIIPTCTDAERLTITPALAEILITTDTTPKKLYMGDGSTVGGVLYGGVDGADGADGTNGTNGSDGAAGDDGADGADGTDANTRHIDVTGSHAAYGTLTGAVNGVNTVYTCSQGVYLTGTVEVYWLGQLITDFVETTPGSGIITLGFAPKSNAAGNEVVMKYEKTA